MAQTRAILNSYGLSKTGVKLIGPAALGRIVKLAHFVDWSAKDRQQ